MQSERLAHLIGFQPEWPAPSFVQAFMTTRQGGVSVGPWTSLNVGSHVGDDPKHVHANRELVAKTLQVQAVYVKQVHGAHGQTIDASTPETSELDVTWTTQLKLACAMMVADCLPLLVCHPHEKWVASVHAGWRGLAGHEGHGVVETLHQAVKAQGLQPQDCLVWLGPCIGQTAFEVGVDVLNAFGNPDSLLATQASFQALGANKFSADLAGIARARLISAGFLRLYGNDSSPPWCTYLQQGLYHSHRRDFKAKGGSGRMAAYIWITDEGQICP